MAKTLSMGITLLKSWLCLYGSLGLCLGPSCSRSEQQNQVGALWQCCTLNAIWHFSCQPALRPSVTVTISFFLHLQSNEKIQGKTTHSSVSVQSWSSLKAWLNAIEHIVCIKEVFFLQKHTHTIEASFSAHIQLSKSWRLSLSLVSTHLSSPLRMAIGKCLWDRRWAP